MFRTLSQIDLLDIGLAIWSVSAFVAIGILTFEVFRHALGSKSKNEEL